METTTRTQDALNRAVRTIIQFIVVDVVLVVIPEIMKALEDESNEIDWDRLGKTAARVALGGILAYAMRLKVPPSETPPPVNAAGAE